MRPVGTPCISHPKLSAPLSHIKFETETTSITERILCHSLCHNSPGGQSGYLHQLHIPNGSDLQRKLRVFVLFSEDNGGHQPGSGGPDLRLMVRVRDVEFSD